VLLSTLVKAALRSLSAHKLRTFLAMLGIIIGVAAVIAMMELGAGAQQQVLERFSAMGTNLLIVQPGQRGMRGVMSGSQQNLTLEDALAVAQEVKDVSLVAPVVGGSAQVKYGNRNSRVTITGSSVTYLPMRGFEVEKGRAFREQEAERQARVAMIGPVTAENLFGDDDPVGQAIKIKGVNFQVIGVLKAKGSQGWFNPDDQVIVPYSTAMKQLFGLTCLREIDINAVEKADLNTVSADVTALLRKRHRLAADAEDDFHIFNQAELLANVSSAARTFTILLGGIAGISLLVGGIGIMNIMLVTVTERTREIGIRKAIGARRRDILGQFLLEAVILTGLGGAFGCLGGTGLATLIGRLTEFSTRTDPFSICLALVFSAAVGIFFGFYPAVRAARLNPIEALRYE